MTAATATTGIATIPKSIVAEKASVNSRTRKSGSPGPPVVALLAFVLRAKFNLSCRAGEMMMEYSSLPLAFPV